MPVSDEQLCERAAAALNPQHIAGVEELLVADVACALVGRSGQVFTGACVGGYLGMCAEQAAVGAMVSREAPEIHTLVAVWRDPDDRSLHALAPCGRCREFLRTLAPTNLDTRIVLGRDHVVSLRDLLPHHAWHAERL